MKGEIDQVTLKPLKFAVARRLNTSAIDNTVGVDGYYDHVANDMVVRLETTVMGKNMDDIVLEHPAGAWEYFVRDYMPRWYSKRFPPKMAKYVVRPVELYPHVAIPEMDPVIHFEKIGYADDWPTD